MKRLRFLAVDRSLAWVLWALARVTNILGLRDSERMKRAIKYLLKKRIENILLNYSR